MDQAKKEIIGLKEEINFVRRKFELRERLLSEKEKANAEREAFLAQQLELIKNDREDMLEKLAFEQSQDSLN